MFEYYVLSGFTHTSIVNSGAMDMISWLKTGELIAALWVNFWYHLLSSQAPASHLADPPDTVLSNMNTAGLVEFDRKVQLKGDDDPA